MNFLGDVIPGSYDAIIAALVGLAAVAGLLWRRGKRGERDSTPPQAPARVPTRAPARKATPPAATPEPAAPEPAAAEPTTPEPAAPGPAAQVTFDRPEAAQGRLARLRSRLGGGFGANLLAIFTRGTLNADDWDELEETLLKADVGAEATDQLLAGLKRRLAHDEDPRAALRAELLTLVDPAMDRTLHLGTAGDGTTAVAVVVGVNGVGKTTTVGKLARLLVSDGHSVVLAAADTFRAAAADQLETWGAHVGVATVRSEHDGADPASVAFEGAQRALADGVDVLLVDTAGRLQNKQGLMDELGKIIRVVSKVAPPSEVLLVLDATTGQNGMTQARVFAEVAGITGIVLTKLDGTAKGGIVVAVQRALGVPVKFVGLGEGRDDLAPFDAEAFVDSLLDA